MRVATQVRNYANFNTPPAPLPTGKTGLTILAPINFSNSLIFILDGESAIFAQVGTRATHELLLFE